MSINFTSDANFDKDASSADLIVLSISREEVERGHIGQLVDRLMALSDSYEHTSRFNGGVLLSFDGYDNDPRELPMITEIVRYARAVHQVWPYWLHFLETGEGHSVATLLKLLCDIELMSHTPRCIFRFTSEPQVRLTLERLVGARDDLHRLHRLPWDVTGEQNERLAPLLNRLLGLDQFKA